NKDIGFVQQGQTARVKLAAYEFQRYGLLEASVESISADSVGNQDGGQANTGYRAYLQLGAQFLEKGEQKFMLRPGMVVTAEIQIGTRSVLEFLLSPISRALDEAGRER
ncbi:MAG: HlyD family type I secretion periplasmic adaptor subunit, partial [Candidatus Zixiibacteriota bacterium]